MPQVIIFKNPYGENVAVCHPTGELPIEEVLTKDCPEGAIIVDDSELPQGEDAEYFDAWELVDGKVTVNQEKKTEIQNAKTAKETALQKLAALGLTEQELAALIK